MRSCLEGDEEAWRRLIHRYRSLVYGIPRRYGLSPADCDDVYQTVFVALVEDLSRLRERRSLAKWLITTTHRTAWRFMRAGSVSPTVDGSALRADEPPDELVELWERRQTLREALDRLDDRCRDLITAMYLDPGRRSYGRVSKRLSMPHGSIGPSHMRCLSRLICIARELGMYDE